MKVLTLHENDVSGGNCTELMSQFMSYFYWMEFGSFLYRNQIMTIPYIFSFLFREIRN